MHIPSIKKLVDNFTIEQLEAAEAALLEGLIPEIEIEGDEDGDKLTHIFGATFILKEMAKGLKYPEALRGFTSKVRTSIDGENKS